MAVAALVTWVLTALGGFYMLGVWISRGGPRTQESRLPAPVAFGHLLLAATGLVLWILYLAFGDDVLARIALGLLVLIALLGFAMLARWIPVYRSRATSTAPERAIPVAVVAGHGLLAVATLVLVVISVVPGS
ncbi:hypothetical protein [Sphaerisporangium fuscum]|uniref:hypothetical protein n=1 Tax=Sphaerisporangium fuscum TaxID=2835868 RepID=UPI001BDC9DC4|nr:hypothetical protein [Sphaerisporangium fuscum]